MGVKLGLVLREEHTLRVFENRVPWRIFGPKRAEVTGDWRKLHMRSFITCTLRQVKLVTEDEMDRACSMNRRREEPI
jgi:hypothetical protein